ncbi:MAG: GAF domain-containing protein [Anaerolineales bacterium]|jgi:NtrC-family two-component system sensor histidine kinase KinB
MEFAEHEKQGARTSLELMYHIGRELASALDLRTLLQRILFLSTQNVGAVNGSIIVLDSQGQPVEAALVVGKRVLEHTTQQLQITFEQGLAGWVARHRQATLIRDTSKDERWLRRPDDADDRTGSKSAVSAPVLARDELVGVMTVVHPTPDSLSEEHLELVQAIADQAGIAVLNARLYAESQRQARVMTALAESASAINASLNTDEVVQQILEQISQALQVEVVSLALIDPHQPDMLEFRATTSPPENNIIGMRQSIDKGIAGWVAREGKGAIVPDAYSDPRFLDTVDKELEFKTQAIVCAPIRAKGQVIGVLEAINPKDGAFDQDALLVLTGIGSLAGTAIEHAELFERLEAAHQRYRELFDDSIDPILLTNHQGAILEANRQAETTTGYDRDGLRSLSVEDLQVVDTQQVGEEFDRLVSGEMISYETTLRTQDEGEIPLQVYVREVLIDGSSQLQWILRDISERRKLDSLREDLTSMIYHDLRSPLANVVSSLDVLSSLLPESGEGSIRSLVNIAMRSTERIQRLTNSLLDINRLEAGQPVVNRQAAPPDVLVKEALDAIRPLALNKDIGIETSVADDLPEVNVDADMIRRVLINLYENAIKFSPINRQIWIGAQMEDTQMVQFWVKDSGAGIPASEHQRIFNKFARLHSKDGPRGLGLGLAYCRLAVEGHGGRIWVESEPDNGSVFHFTVPPATQATSESSTSS